MSINPEERIKSLTVEYLYAKMAQINISELMTAVKVAPSYKEMVESQTSPDILVPNYVNERDYFGKDHISTKMRYFCTFICILSILILQAELSLL